MGPRLRRSMIVVALAVLALVDPEARGLIVDALAGAYLQVGVFVAGTLAVFYALENDRRVDLAGLLERRPAQAVVAAAFLGALPGCGGAVIVMTQFVRGKLGFGAVVAVLTATMGDAAFLLLARRPLVGIGVIALGFVAGVLSGWIVNRLHGPNFMRQEPREPDFTCIVEGGRHRGLDLAWAALLVPGVILGLFVAFSPDVGDIPLVRALGATAGILTLGIWMLGRGGYGAERAPLLRVVPETCFITAWVICGFLAFDLMVHYTRVDLQGLFYVAAPLLPLAGVVVGFLPGCGPQIIVTTLYLNGVAPLSAQLGNAMSNDGDALFPAIAFAPRAAIVATLYTAVPAILISYACFFLER